MRFTRLLQALALVCLGINLFACRPQTNESTPLSTNESTTPREPAPAEAVTERELEPVAPEQPIIVAPPAQPESSEMEEAIDTEQTSKLDEEETETSEAQPDDFALFQDLRNNHWAQIFPNGRRNVGGPQFFKYIYERLATSHDLFRRYSKFYCGVSGSIVRPRAGDVGSYDTVKIKDADGQCVVGKYYRCCWPCVCDIMKHARAEPVTVKLPLDETGAEQTYWVLTMGDPCHRCDASPCPDLPTQVQAYRCEDGVTANGLRVHEGRLTTGTEGRLVFALLHDAAPATETAATVSDELLTRCTPRINATPEELSRMGGMGNIFVDVTLINAETMPTNSFADLCE